MTGMIREIVICVMEETTMNEFVMGMVSIHAKTVSTEYISSSVNGALIVCIVKNRIVVLIVSMCEPHLSVI